MAELLEAGLNLTLVGMSVVFALLTLLVGAIHLMSRFCRLFDAPPAETETAAAAEPDAELVGVISAAVRMFRRDRAHGSTS